MLPDSSVRLNKYISESGICSRREADRYIEQGNVFLNGKRATIGDQVKPGDVVKVNGQLIEPREAEDLVLIALNKPVGIVSTTEDGERDNIVDFVNHSKRVFPIGRLDKDSQGLIFLTNHGDLVNKILRAGNDHEKEYLVTVDKPITEEFIRGMSAGVPILGTVTKKCKVKKEAPFVFRITLVQGLNRQIRRMCEALGYRVTKLKRVRIMNIHLKDLKTGEYRPLTEKELAVYGKGGIGKSTTVSNVSAALAEMGLKVMQIGCDPKADSTINLLGGEPLRPVMNYMREEDEEPDELAQISKEGYGGILCIETGGPTPGLGCAGRGIIATFSLLEDMELFEHYKPDVVLYDVLGDVVCGGFAAPIREGYADKVLIVTSGEKMALYAANNISSAVRNFEDRSYALLAYFTCFKCFYQVKFCFTFIKGR